MKKIVFLAFVLVLLAISWFGRFTKPVEASGTIHIKPDGSIDPPTANIASWDNVTYTFTDNINDSIVVERNSIVVDGAGYTLQGIEIQIGINLTGRRNVTVKNMEIKAFDYGIHLSFSNSNIIYGNNITANRVFGIRFHCSSNNTISGNNIKNNYYGVLLDGSANNTVSGNNITTNNCCGMLFLDGSANNTVSGNNITAQLLYSGIRIDDSANNIISGNNITANNYGVRLHNSSNGNIISGNNITANRVFGIRFHCSSNNTISGNNIKNNHSGVRLDGPANGSSISGNNIEANSYYGIRIDDSANGSSISGNNIKNNHYGIWLHDSSENVVYHNNFVNNTEQVYSYESTNVWDDDYPSGGNYWRDHVEIDLDHDGIGDFSHFVDADNTDWYPLMGMFNSFNTSLGFYVNIVSNSTVDDFEYFESNSTIKMYVSNMTETQTYGFCRMCIHHALMNVTNISVIIDDGITPVLLQNYTLHDNSTHRWIYFAYETSTHEVDVIPEFPTLTPILLLLIVLTVALVMCKRELLKTLIH